VRLLPRGAPASPRCARFPAVRPLPRGAPASARVRRESWFAAFAGIIAAPVIGRVTAVGGTRLGSLTRPAG